MKKTELKALLKPLIKECIKEVMFEDGILSGIVSEVATGMGRIQIVEAKSPKAQRQPSPLSEDFGAMQQKSLQEQKQKLDIHRKKLLDAVGKDSYNGINIFEGTTPLKSGPSPGAPSTPQGPLAGVDSQDSGVDISNLFENVGRNWEAHLKREK